MVGAAGAAIGGRISLCRNRGSRRSYNITQALLLRLKQAGAIGLRPTKVRKAVTAGSLLQEVEREQVEFNLEHQPNRLPMHPIPWYLAALGAALSWGIHYPLVEHALRRISLVSVLLLTAVPIALLAALFHEQIGADIRTVAGLGWRDKLPILTLMLTSLAGTVLLFTAIGARNAAMAAVIEISYPLFVALFAWLLFRRVEVNASLVIGGLLVFSGVAIIILNNR